MKPLFKHNGIYMGFINNNCIFSRDGDYLGWVEQNFCWDSKGKFKGQIWKDKYVILNQFAVPAIPRAPRPAPPAPVLPPPPQNIAPVNLPVGFVDSF